MADGSDPVKEQLISWDDFMLITVGQAKASHEAGIKYVIKEGFRRDYDREDAIRDNEDWWRESNISRRG